MVTDDPTLITWPPVLRQVPARGTRRVRPMLRQATSSHLSAPRPWMNRAW